jgi:murein DD-endopeptidase MepM/ murein hydrolase activator NlpD
MLRSALISVAVLLATTACGTAEAVRGSAGPPATTTTTKPPRSVTETAWTPFASAGPVILTHPSSRVERVAFHQSTHDGARQLTALPAAVAPTTLEDRERDTGRQGAADVVVDPTTEIRSPVTGRVKRAGGYVLYCDHSDDYVVIEPDDRPGWEVKILHIDGVRVRAGNRVIAGQTVIAPRPTQLPFESQVDKVRTADPAWPHVHIEVVDPTIPDRPTGPGCT